MMTARFTLPALLALAIAACQQSNDDSNITIDNEINAAEAANADVETLPPSEESGDPDVTNRPDEADDDGSDDAGQLVIPAAFRGRWGMVPADCTSTRGDAKGLIVVGPKTIRFYESLATLTDVTLNAPENFTGDFSFIGEGQTWTKSQNLKLTGSSNTLKRAEEGGTFTYTRCA